MTIFNDELGNWGKTTETGRPQRNTEKEKTNQADIQTMGSLLSQG